MDRMVSKYSFNSNFVYFSWPCFVSFCINLKVSNCLRNKMKEEQGCSSISETCLSVPCSCSQIFSIWTTDVLPYLAIKRDSFVLCFFWSSSSLHQIQQQPEPTVHVDAFLYDEDFIDSLCEEGKMSRNYCMVCGSHQTAPLGRHSTMQTWWFCVFSLHFMRIQILFFN